MVKAKKPVTRPGRQAAPALKDVTEVAESVDSAVEASPAIFERPDGYYWLAPDERQEFGPFGTYELARADRDALSEEAIAPGEALHEAQRDIGIADWLDPETGEPAEGGSPPHLSEE